MARYSGRLLTYPARATFAWFAGLMVLGSIALSLPISQAPDREPLSPVDAVFTATSAACVTGLTVRSTPHDFSLFGQFVQLVLMQLGGIGIMTVTTFITLRFGGRQTIGHKVALAQTLGTTDDDMLWVLRRVLGFIFLAEAVGFLVLLTYNLASAPSRPLADAAWEAVFHTVSAFCNGGLSLYDDSLVRYQSSVVVNLTMISLIVVGGLGFPVVLDLQRALAARKKKQRYSLALHTRIMLIGTGGLLTLGAIAILALEWDQALAGLPLRTKLLIASFQSVTPRTAGFNTIAMTSLTDATLFVIIILMMIGAGPCSTAGGFKVSTFMVLVCQAWSRIRGWQRVKLYRRTIPAETVDSAMATALLFGVVAASAMTALLFFEAATRGAFLKAVFEVASALGTVGLSLDFTATMSGSGKIIVIVLMFLGRLGPISVFAALSRGERKDLIEYPKEQVLIG